MKKVRLNIIILIIVLLCMIGGCNKSTDPDNPDDITVSPSPTSDVAVTPTIPPATEPSAAPTAAPTASSTAEPTIIPTLTPEELSIYAYEKFLKNETGISFDRCMHKGFLEGTLYNQESEYTLSEVLDIITKYYLEGRKNTKIASINYNYIDCGKDGVNELALCFNGMEIYAQDDDSTLVYIIKYIDGKLYLCHYYETWARSYTSINEYGFIESYGSNAASNSGRSYSLIDKDGNWHPIVYIESEMDINQLSWSEELGQFPGAAEAKGISGGIQLDTILFNYDFKTYAEDNIERYYTFYVYDENWEPIEDVNLYTDSIYKEIFDEAKVPFITPDEANAMILDREENMGVTTEIKEGSILTWKTLDGDMFSDYVGR